MLDIKVGKRFKLSINDAWSVGEVIAETFNSYTKLNYRILQISKNCNWTKAGELFNINHTYLNYVYLPGQDNQNETTIS